jgi:hypothetical protein
MATLTQLTGDADGTLDTSNLQHDTGTGTPWFSHMNDAPDGVSTDFVRCNGSLNSGNYFTWVGLSNVDADFGNMDTLNIDVDVLASGFDNDTCALTARIADGNGSVTFLTAETATLGAQTDTTRTQRNVAFSALTGTKTQWNNAYIRFQWTYTKVTSPDTAANLRIFGFDIDGTYTASGSGRTMGSLAGEGGLAGPSGLAGQGGGLAA